MKWKYKKLKLKSKLKSTFKSIKTELKIICCFSIMAFICFGTIFFLVSLGI